MAEPRAGDGGQPARPGATDATAEGSSDVATGAKAGDTVATTNARRRGEPRMAHGRAPSPGTASGTAALAPPASGSAVTGSAPAGHTDPASIVVRKGETPWTAPELDAIRAELDGELSRIQRDLESLQSSIAEVLRDSGDGAGDDTADTGSKAFEREQEMTLVANTRETLFQTERALQRIADGSYGSCESCGEGVGKARLQAFPRATLCVSCKQRQERR
jgi:RNA polymerase-binding transcription factor